METATSDEQREVERDVASLYSRLWKYASQHPGEQAALPLNKGDHARYLRGALGKLPGAPPGFVRHLERAGSATTSCTLWPSAEVRVAASAVCRAGASSATASLHAHPRRSRLAVCAGGYASLDASRPWIVYWATHGLNLLQLPHNKAVPPDAIARFLATCQQPSGGFAGGPHQIAHLAPTCAST